MSNVIYNPEEVGKNVTNSKGDLSIVRKYHLTPEEFKRSRAKWLKTVDHIDQSIKDKAGEKFFNPYRKGIYFYQIQSLFLLGSNEWHSLPSVTQEIKEFTSKIKLKPSDIKKYGCKTFWDHFRGKRTRGCASSKDYLGRIQENFVILQRLSCNHPYGYKLHQVCSAIDIKRDSREGFENGVYYYRLSTYSTKRDAFPIKDFSCYDFPSHEGKYVSRKFIGTIITKDRTICNIRSR